MPVELDFGRFKLNPKINEETLCLKSLTLQNKDCDGILAENEEVMNNPLECSCSFFAIWGFIFRQNDILIMVRLVRVITSIGQLIGVQIYEVIERKLSN